MEDSEKGAAYSERLVGILERFAEVECFEVVERRGKQVASVEASRSAHYRVASFGYNTHCTCFPGRLGYAACLYLLSGLACDRNASFYDFLQLKIVWLSFSPSFFISDGKVVIQSYPFSLGLSTFCASLHST